MIDLRLGDCVDVMKVFDSESIDCVITSPPYDNLRTYKDTLDFTFDKFKIVANELFRVIKQGGVVVWVVGDATYNGSETLTSFKQALYFKEIGFNVHDTMIYRKVNPVPNSGNRYQQSFEYMFVFSKGKPKTTNILLTDRRNNTNDRRTCRYRKKFNREKDGEFRERENYLEYFKDEVPRENIWEYTVGLYNSTSDKIAFKHPAIFPEQLASDHIKSWTNKNDIVLDPFMGSGTVGKMCSILHRNFIGIELVEEYYKIAKERIDETIKVNSRKLKVKSIFGKL